MAAIVRQADVPAPRLWWKPVLDIGLAVPALVILSPVFAIVAIAVRANLGSPVIFRQQRPGKHGRPFTLYKFRTMRDASRDSAPSCAPRASMSCPSSSMSCAEK